MSNSHSVVRTHVQINDSLFIPSRFQFCSLQNDVLLTLPPSDLRVFYTIHQYGDDKTQQYESTDTDDGDIYSQFCPFTEWVGIPGGCHIGGCGGY